MKRILFVLLLVISALGFGQVVDTFQDKFQKGATTMDAEHPLEIQIERNTWYDFYPEVYSIHDLLPAIGQMVLELRPNMVLAQSTTRILAEGNERRALDGEEFVNKTSSIFERGTIKPAEWILRCSFSGSGTTESRGFGVRLGGNQVGLATEGGTSVATARYELIRRKDFLVVGVATATEVYKSENILGLDASRFSFFSLRQALAFRQSNNGGYRRGLVSTSGNLKNKTPEAIRQILSLVK